MRTLLVIVGIIAAWWAYTVFTRGPVPAGPDSAITTRLAAAEQDYYRQVFNYAMDNIEAGKEYEWASYGGKGGITPGAPFVSNLRSHCRDFSEIIHVGETSEKREGVACRREGAEGWCRLRKDQVATCAMETPAGVAGGIDGPNVNATVPSINIPSGGGVSGPNARVGDPNMPNAQGDPDAPSGQEVADTVTGTAGDLGGKGSKTFFDWFFGTFR